MNNFIIKNIYILKVKRINVYFSQKLTKKYKNKNNLTVVL